MNYGSEEAPINRAQQIPKLRGRQTGVATVAGQTMEVSLFASGELCRFLMNCSIGETLILEGPRISSSSVQCTTWNLMGRIEVKEGELSRERKLSTRAAQDGVTKEQLPPKNMKNGAVPLQLQRNLPKQGQEEKLKLE